MRARSMEVRMPLSVSGSSEAVSVVRTVIMPQHAADSGTHPAVDVGHRRHPVMNTREA